MTKSQFRSQIGLSLRQRRDSSSLPWLDKLRESFNEVDIEGSGSINITQFRNSGLRFLISDTPITPQEMDDVFHQIDADSDNLISWGQLIEYLLCIQRSLAGDALEKRLQLTFMAPTELVMKKYHRSSVCLRAAFIPALGQIVGLTETQMIFYNRGECVPVRTFSDHDNFVDFTYMPCIYKIALAKQNRQVVFYDLRTNTKDPYVISASVEALAVPKMDLTIARIVSRKCHRRVIPLFNTPCSICSIPDEPTLFIGDDRGGIEVFTMIVSKEEQSNWSSRWDGIVQMHDGPVIQMNYFPTLEKYISASADGTICLWRYDSRTRAMNRAYLFVEPRGLMVRSFVYDVRTRDLVYTTSAHEFGVWRVNTDSHQSVELHSQVISTLEIYQVGDLSYLLLFSKTNIVSIYRMPGLESCGTWYLGMQHELCPPTGCVIMNNFCYLIGAFMSCWRFESSAGTSERPHSNKIKSAIANDVFNTVISLDSHGDVCTWNMKRGMKNYSYSVYEPGCEVSCAALDAGQRRLGLSYTDGRVKIISAVAGSDLYQIDKKFVENGCVWLEFAYLGGQNTLIICTGSKSILLFQELHGNRTRFIRAFFAHTEDIIMATTVNERYIVSVGAGRELFLWKLSSPGPMVRYSLPNDPTIVCDLGRRADQFLVGDIAGFVHFLARSQTTPIKTIDAFGMTIKSPITRIAIREDDNFVTTGNLHGYVKFWRLMPSDLEPIRWYRAHSDPVVSISVSSKHGLVVTASDQHIRLWSVDPFGMVGAFGAGQTWQSSDPSTWLRDGGFDPDPIHFAKPAEAESKAVMESVEGSSDEESGNGDLVGPDQRLSAKITGNMLDEMEELIENGRKLREKEKAHADSLLYPLTTRRAPHKSILDGLQVYGLSAVSTQTMARNAALQKIIKPRPAGD
jgi:WD40 repeat protein